MGSRRDTSPGSPAFILLHLGGCPCHGCDGWGGFGKRGVSWHCQPGTGRGSLAQTGPW